MNRRTVLKELSAALAATRLHSLLRAAVKPGSGTLPVASGPFEPTWQSLAQYRTPDWFRDAKFGMWAHWGPQCQPEAGDWYARGMYQEGSRQYKLHLEKYGHPSVFGFKDVIHSWKAERWDPDALVGLYKKTGARYFMAMGGHEDNFDLYNSRYQPWNSVNVGPKKDILAGWARAARNHGLPFGVSIHTSHTWTWMETAQRSDKAGTLAGVPYDGNATRAAGKGKWWDGLDPQELYAQNHPLSVGSLDDSSKADQWEWANGASQPSQAYCDKYVNRLIDLIDRYGPDLIYFDDTVLPFWPFNDAGLRIAAHYYNRSVHRKGWVDVVIFGKILDAHQRPCMVLDIERGHSNAIEPLPWQGDTCIGNWHYDRGIYDRQGYKSAETVIHALVDSVSKNGNMLLNIPVRGDGTIDEQEQQIVDEIGDWMRLNGESIYGTRPWKVMGEGPAMANAASVKAGNFNEKSRSEFTAEDIRFVTKGGALFATFLGWPLSGAVNIVSLRSASPHRPLPIQQVELLSTREPLDFERTADGLRIRLPEKVPPQPFANVLKIV